MKKYILLLVALCVSLSLSAQVDTTLQAVVEPVEETVLPATTEAMWDAANTAYINNEYGRARDIYEAILQRGEVSGFREVKGMQGIAAYTEDRES